ncbi:hypothetical protein CEXT_749631 [Caerostris extrusa]|uniref:Uncharacterized protein n=1 Tax=Caerostris extrusa TaxID=172846 RepID=A0AAV4T871_CAEEX|nr:hypothetical protein CEXT_749631 [Caerostris extrusa]
MRAADPGSSNGTEGRLEVKERQERIAAKSNINSGAKKVDCCALWRTEKEAAAQLMGKLRNALNFFFIFGSFDLLRELLILKILTHGKSKLSFCSMPVGRCCFPGPTMPQSCWETDLKTDHFPVSRKKR